jgi:large subunit ribosomal protein L18
MSKITSRQRRLTRTRRKIIELGAVRLCVYKSNLHIYAQVFSATGAEVIAQASTLDKAICGPDAEAKGPGKLKIAAAVGDLVAKRAKEKGVSRVAFDRSGFKYHGLIKAVAEAARAGGLEF